VTRRANEAMSKMALLTLVSRITGLLRLVLLAYALGYTALAAAFNLANNTPNIVHDLVLGGVLAATFVPVFVDRRATRSEPSATQSIAAVITIASVILILATLFFELGAPGIIDLYTLGSHGTVSAAERAVSVELLRLFAPQLLCYGAIAIMTSVLNTTGRFTLPAAVPILNNLVGIGVLLAFAVTARAASLSTVQHDFGLLVLLGAGTTAGVGLQALALVPATLRCGIALRPVWRPHDPAVRMVLRLAGWTFGVVVTNQVAVFIVLALAVRVGPAAVSAYTYAFIFFQLPFGTIAISVMSVVTPELSRLASLGDRDGLRRRYSIGMRQMLAAVIPAAVGEIMLALPAVTLLLKHGASSTHGVDLTAAVLVLLALGLPSYCTYLLTIRVFQSMQNTRVTFGLYVIENGLNIALAMLLVGHLGARGLGIALTLAYTAAAIAAIALLSRRLGGIDFGRFLPAVGRAVALSVVMAVAIAAVEAAFGPMSGLGLLLEVLACVIVAAAVYVGGAGVGSMFGGSGRGRRTGG